MKELLSQIAATRFFTRLGLTGLVILVVAFFLLVLVLLPMLFLWSLNSLAELGGVDFYIAHGIWSYFVSLVFLGAIRGSSS